MILFQIVSPYARSDIDTVVMSSRFGQWENTTTYGKVLKVRVFCGLAMVPRDAAVKVTWNIMIIMNSCVMCEKFWKIN